MPLNRLAAVRISAAVVVAICIFFAGSRPSAAQLPLEPGRESGQSVTAAYEGWYPNSDGTYSLLVGYYNRNHSEMLDIPIGRNNRIEPGGPDQGQPTHFLPRRQWGVFIIIVPADFRDKKLTWTLVAHNKTTEIPMGLATLWEVSPLKDMAQGNTPPVLRFDSGSTQQGPPHEISQSLDATVAEPTMLRAWASDDGLVDAYRRSRASDPPVNVTWSKFRGPGDVAFSETKPPVDPSDGKATTTATFTTPGEYILRLQANDVSREGGGGAQCCWTNAHVKVTVKPGAGSW